MEISCIGVIHIYWWLNNSRSHFWLCQCWGHTPSLKGNFTTRFMSNWRDIQLPLQWFCLGNLRVQTPSKATNGAGDLLSSVPLTPPVALKATSKTFSPNTGNLGSEYWRFHVITFLDSIVSSIEGSGSWLHGSCVILVKI